jgi:hypothetical protein
MRPDIRARRSTWGSLADQLLGIADPVSRNAWPVTANVSGVTCILRQMLDSPAQGVAAHRSRTTGLLARVEASSDDSIPFRTWFWR